MTGEPADREIRVERRERVAIATFDRPEVLNAFRGATYRRLLDILDEVSRDEELRVLVLTGAGRAFSSGTDLKELADEGAVRDDPTAARAAFDVERNQEITRRLIALPQITIAAVNGLAVGFGAELAISCDIRVASEDARFMFPEVKRALFLTNGVTWLLPRMVGLGRAMEWLASGRPVSATEALGAGLVTEIVGREHLLDLALDIAGAIAANAPLSVRMVKRALHAAHDDLETALAAETRDVLACRATADWREGLQSFAEKRPPRYRGA